MAVTLAQATTIVDAALKMARERKTMSQTVVVLDARGQVVCTQRDDGAGLRAAGLDVYTPAGTYFVTADAAGLGITDSLDLARRLPELVGVAAIPVPVFCHQEGAERTKSLLRFAFCKKVPLLQQAAEQLSTLKDRL